VKPFARSPSITFFFFPVPLIVRHKSAAPSVSPVDKTVFTQERTMSLANGTSSRQPDLIVVGAGLAGLTAAALVAKAGRPVVVLEQAGSLGGRAATQVRQGVHFNLGAHALYRRGHAYRIFTELGVPFTGRFPSTGRALVTRGNTPYRLPQGPVSLFASRLLSLREKWRMAGLLAGFQRIDARPFDRVPLSDQVRQLAGTGNLAQLLHGLFRLSTYVNDPERMSAGVAIRQLQMALGGNVLYLDGGWQTLVEGLRARAAEHGAEIRTGARVTAVRSDGGTVTVHLAGGEAIRGKTAVLAVPPSAASELLDLPAEDALARRYAACIAVRAACLDVALARLSQPAYRFALGLDRPLYYSVHSASAKLAPEGVAVVHLMKYLGDDASPAEVAEREMETLLDRLQPGWREQVVARRFLPGMTVANDLPRAEEGGLSGRPAVTVRERPGIFLAGDWVGAEGMLADASAASAAEAARCILAGLTGANVRPERSAAHVNN
jgi:phytoene dehydrogenase-like protein